MVQGSVCTKFQVSNAFRLAKAWVWHKFCTHPQTYRNPLLAASRGFDFWKEHWWMGIWFQWFLMRPNVWHSSPHWANRVMSFSTWRGPPPFILNISMGIYVIFVGGLAKTRQCKISPFSSSWLAQHHALLSDLLPLDISQISQNSPISHSQFNMKMKKLRIYGFLCITWLHP